MTGPPPPTLRSPKATRATHQDIPLFTLGADLSSLPECERSQNPVVPGPQCCGCQALFGMNGDSTQVLDKTGGPS